MSIIPNPRQDNGGSLPRVNNIPPVPARVVHQDFAEEALRAAQRYIDQAQEIATLSADRDDWRNRALLAEAEVQRMIKRETELMEMLDRKTEEHCAERGEIEQTIAVLAAQYTTASKIILDGFATIDKLGDLKAKISIPVMAAALEPRPSDPHDEAAPAKDSDAEPFSSAKGPLS